MQISLSERSIPDATGPAVTRAAPSDRGAGSGGASFVAILRGLGREIDRGEATTRAALAPSAGLAHLDPERLLALQAGVYRYSEAVDLTSRLIDRATGAVKAVLQGGGQ